MNAELLALADKRAALSADLEKVQTELDQADLRIKELESRLAAQSPEPVACIRLRPYEIQSGLDRVRWAEGLIRQLPDNHDGRNAWLANYAGDKHDADKIRFCVDRDTANGANKDNTFFYLAVCNRETFAKAFAASNTGGHHG